MIPILQKMKLKPKEAKEFVKFLLDNQRSQDDKIS